MTNCVYCGHLLDDDGVCGECEDHKEFVGNLLEGIGRNEMKTAAANDNVNNPSHYGQGSIECIDYIKDFLTDEEYIGYLRGNIAKYQHRWRYKNGLEDLKKSNWYLQALIQHQSKK